MTNEQLNVKYVDLQGLRLFAEELKKWLKSHVVETDIYKELLYRIENLELYKIVETLPEEGDEDTIYLLRNPNEEDKNHFIEYLYSKEHGWEEIGKFIPDIKLEEYLKIQDSPFEKGSGQNSVVLKGTSNSATNKFATAFGEQTIASADRAFSEGLKTTASGANSHAEGLSTLAEGQNSHAEGNKCKAIGNHSHAEGNDTIANGGASHAEGSGTITQNNFEHAEGRYNFSNKEDSSNNWGGYNTIHSVGIGNSNNNRKNAHEILQNGKHYILGIGGYDGTNAVTPNAQGIIAKSVQEVINELINKLNEITTND